jgi:penicillin-binding protein 1C
LEERLSLAHEPAAFIAPHFVERVLALGGSARPGAIVTSLDAELQRTVEGIIRAQRPGLEKIGAYNVAAVVLDNSSGEWLAWEGSGDRADARHGGAIDGVITPRQPGSALKPFTYALAFEDGESPATVLPDIPSYFPTAEDGILYSPKNYDSRFRGPLLARHALAGSENVPAVALASRVGVPNLLRFLRAAGFSTFEKNAAYYGLGVTLGDAEVRLDQLVAAYASFARGGVAVRPTFVREPAPPQAPDASRLMSPRTAFWITDILSDDEARAFAFGRGGSLEFPFPVAAKTGTSQAYRDNWAIGYTRRVTVGVWVGNFDRRPLVGSSGVSGAGPIFHAIMLAAERHTGDSVMRADESATVALPEQTVRRPICALSGLAATRWCPSQVDEWQAADAPNRPCTWHRPTARGIVVDWPAEYVAWARAERLLDRVAAVPISAAIAPRRAKEASTQSVDLIDGQPLRVASPPDGAVYLIDPTLRREFQSLSLRATAVDHVAIEWRVDGTLVGGSPSEKPIDWRLSAGRHIIAARDGNGHQASATIVVK